MAKYVATFFLVTILIACNRSDPAADAAAFVAGGDKFAAAGKYNEAIIQYRNAIAVDAKAAAAYGKLGDAYVAVNDGRNALRAMVRAADLQPLEVSAQIKAGQMLLLAQQFEDAKQRADRALAVDARNVAALILRGNASAGLRNMESAVQDVSEAVALAPEDARGQAALAAIQVVAGNVATAEDTFKKAVQLEPNSAEPQLALANYYLASGRVADAEEPLRRAGQIDPGNVAAARGLAVYLLGTRRTAEAEAPLKRLAELSKTAESQIALADYYLALKRDTEAVKVLQPLAEKVPEAALRLAAVDFANGRQGEAKRHLEEVLNQHPKESKALILKAQFLIAEALPEEAMSVAMAAVSLGSGSAAAHYVLGQAAVAAKDFGVATSAFAEALLLNPKLTAAKSELAKLNLRAGRAVDALSLAEQANRENGDSIDGRLLIARTQIAAGKFDDADATLKKIAAERSDFASIHVLRGIASAAQGRTPAAKAEFERALALEPKNLEALNGLVSADVAAGNLASARALIERRMSDGANDVGVSLIAANVYGASRDFVRQQEVLQRVIAREPNNMVALMGLASTYVNQNKLPEAQVEYERAYKANPKNLGAATMLGIIQEAQGQVSNAMKTYEAIVAVNSRAAIPANNLAWLRAENNGDLDSALQLAQTAVALQPESPQFNDTLGWIFVKKNLPTLAVRPLQTAVRNNPTNAVYHYHLGVAYGAALDITRAHESLSEAVRLNPALQAAAVELKRYAPLFAGN